MKVKFFILTCFALLIFSGCTHEPEVQADCKSQMLTQYNMIPYNGGITNCCKFFLILYEWNGKQYFSLGNPCANMIPKATDCNGNKVADMIPKATDCNGNEVTDPAFWSQATNLGIIGIEP